MTSESGGARTDGEPEGLSGQETEPGSPARRADLELDQAGAREGRMGEALPRDREGDRHEPVRQGALSWWQWTLGHHPRSQWDRCYVFRLGAKQIPLCARCLGLYPAMLLGLVLGQVTGWQVPSWLLGAMLALGFADWSLTRIGYRSGANVQRTVTGAVAGFALGWAVGARLPLWLSSGQLRVVLVAALAAAMVELAALRMD